MCHHLVALAQLGHARADRRDRPGRLRPERHRSRAADLPAADPDKLVPGADARRNDLDEDLACGRRRKLVHLEDLDGLAERCDPSHSHPVRRTLLASVMRRAPLWHLARGVRREQVTDDLPARARLRLSEETLVVVAALGSSRAAIEDGKVASVGINATRAHRSETTVHWRGRRR